MLNTLIIALLVAGFAVAIASIRIKKLRAIAFGLACCCVAACCCHQFFKLNPDREYVRILADGDVKAKMEYFKNTNSNVKLKKYVIYSIADQIENLSFNNFKTAFVDNDDAAIVELLFDRLRENGLQFSDEQLDCFIEAAISDKNACFRKRLFPSIFAVNTVFKYVRNCLSNIDDVEHCCKLKKCIDAFPEIFSENDRKLGQTILEAKNNIDNADGSDAKFNTRLAELAALKEDCGTKLLAIAINWSLRGTVERKLEDLENAYLLKDANIEGKSLTRCIVVPTETTLEINTQVKIDVKDEGEQYYKLEDGFATLRYFKEDHSAGSRNSLQEQIKKCDEEIVSINATIESGKDQLDVYKALFQASLDSFRKNFAQKVNRYEY